MTKSPRLSLVYQLGDFINNFRTEIGCINQEKSKFSKILLGDKNATSLCSKNISTLTTIRFVNSQNECLSN